jgi:hypothetical protein
LAYSAIARASASAADEAGSWRAARQVREVKGKLAAVVNGGEKADQTLRLSSARMIFNGLDDPL